MCGKQFRKGVAVRSELAKFGWALRVAGAFIYGPDGIEEVTDGGWRCRRMEAGLDGNRAKSCEPDRSRHEPRRGLEP